MRELGYAALEFGTSRLAVAVPVYDGAGGVAGALGASLPTPTDLTALIAALQGAATRISKTIRNPLIC